MYTVWVWDDVDLRTVIWCRVHFLDTAMMVLDNLRADGIECGLMS